MINNLEILLNDWIGYVTDMIILLRYTAHFSQWIIIETLSHSINLSFD